MSLISLIRMCRVNLQNLTSLLVFVFVAGYSCSGNSGQEQEPGQGSAVRKEDLVRANQFLTGKDMDLIKAYAKRRSWDLEFSKTGLGYQIYEKGDGPEVKRGATVTLEYTLSLLDGRICYSSENDGLKTFRTGQGGVEAGLEEGVLLLRAGDRARLVLPPYLGHGLIGDQLRIPPRAVLIYEIKVVNVSGS
jgi:FKBP-type peptidyl-prolyl cis-trans isomerase FkpA